MPRALLNLFPHIVVDFHIEDIRYKIQRILVVLHLRVEPSQVETVRQIVFVDLAEVLISTGRDELRDWSVQSNSQKSRSRRNSHIWHKMSLWC